MEACGLIVEYNPLHNGHVYHIKKAKQLSQASCLIVIMSGSFLQRGEPAIIDKIHRTKAALAAGADIVLELPYPFAVQSSNFFASGAVHTLNKIGASSLCFGSESGNINYFLNNIKMLHNNKQLYDDTIKRFLYKGLSFPDASNQAYKAIGINSNDMFQPNNILGLSYVKSIIENNFPITPLTIQRIKNDYHEQTITNDIASATSIRNELTEYDISKKVQKAMPHSSLNLLKQYKDNATIWHAWENYFPFLSYKVITMSPEQLSKIHSVEEGIEFRIKKTVLQATSFNHWLELMKTKRYTRTRLQRMFVHILTNTTKLEMMQYVSTDPVQYIRLLGLNKIGQDYLNRTRDRIDVPIISQFRRKYNSLLTLDERASNVYYSVLPLAKRNYFRNQELHLPILSK